MIRQRHPIERSPLKPRKSNIARSTKRIRSVNPEAKAKRDKKYKAFLSSAKWKQLRRQALDRAGHRCEQRYHPSIWRCDVRVRCSATNRLHVDHETYIRFGGDELPGDLKVRCFDCHMRRHALEGKRIA